MTVTVMWQRYLTAILVFLPIPAFSHPPYHHDLYYYPNKENPKIIAQAHYLDGIVFNDPVSFKAFDHLGNTIVETSYVHTMEVFQTKDGGAYIFAFDSFLFPFSTEIFNFNGQRLTNITSLPLVLVSPALRFWNNVPAYLIIGFIYTIPVFIMIRVVTGKRRRAIVLWWGLSIFLSFLLLVLIPMLIFLCSFNIVILLIVFCGGLGFELLATRGWRRKPCENAGLGL